MSRLRDEVEVLIDSWDAYETARGGVGIIDYDARPARTDATPAPDRRHVLARVEELLLKARREGDTRVVDRLEADRAYLSAMLGQRTDLPSYLAATQGTSANGWTDAYIEERGAKLRAHLAERGIAWGKQTGNELRELEGPISAADSPDAISEAAQRLEPVVREYAESAAPFDLSIEPVEEDAYWAYWLDGSGSRVRLRLNVRNLSMSKVSARQFALHEVLGHGLLYCSLAHEAGSHDVSWPRQFSVHGPHQSLFEGLAQAWPLFATPDDPELMLRLHLDHYRQLVSAKAHLEINSGGTVQGVFATLRQLVPYWSDEVIGDLLTDRANNPQLRSYLWSYPAGLDWFVRLGEADAGIAQKVIRLAHVQPLTPSELHALWPDGPALGGP